MNNTIIGLTPHEQNLWQLLEPTVTDSGLELVRLKLIQRGGPVLEVMVDKTGGVTIDDCAEVSRRMSRVLDVEDPLPDAYQLEVSSPGVERPLTTLTALQAHIGRQVKVQLHQAMEGGRKLKGTLTAADETHIAVTTEKGPQELDLLNVQDVTLTLTKEDYAALLKGAK